MRWDGNTRLVEIRLYKDVELSAIILQIMCTKPVNQPLN